MPPLAALRRVTLLLLSTLALPLAAQPVSLHYPSPRLEDPPAVGRPFVIATTIPLEDYGYEAREYFFSGTARAWRNPRPLDADGKWLVVPAAQADYRTRMVVYRPVDPALFNGSAIVEWLNVTAGVDTAADWITTHTELLRGGYAWVGVSAQAIGVEGGEPPLPTPLGGALPLKRISPQRYASLSHPGDSFSYDIFAQAAQALRAPAGASPLGELQAQRVIAAGESQSATRLTTFVAERR